MPPTTLAEHIGAWGIVFFALYWSYTLFLQGREIWQKKSGASISTLFVLYFYFNGSVYAIYGLEHGQWPMVVHGVLRGFFFIFILLGLLKFKKFTRVETLTVFILLGSIILQITTNLTTAIFIVSSWGGVVASCLQPIEFFQKKSIGVFKPQMAIVLALANIFWTIYSFAIGDIQLQILCLAYYPSIVATVGLYLRYR